MQSGAHYRLAAQDQGDLPLRQRLGAGPGRDKTVAMTIGSGAHAVAFETPLAVYDGRRAGKAWDAFQLEHEGAAIMNPREYGIARGIGDAIRRHPLAHLLFDSEMVHEQRIDWTWLDGRAVRCTPDARSQHRLVELKTTRCAEPKRFARDAMFRGYHAQVALYADGIIEAGLGTATERYIFAVENAEPFNVSVIIVDDHTLDEGRRMIRLCAELAQNWERCGVYPGYPEVPVQFCDMVDVAADSPFQLRVNGEEMEIE